jgi:hypothetical protein
MRNAFYLTFSLSFFSLFSHAQRVGIGTDAPLARLAIDSGLIIDQGNFNNTSVVGGNVGLWFGGTPFQAGISSHKNPASQALNGLVFYTGSATRIIINQAGRVGIGTNPDPVYRLRVSGTIYSDFQLYSAGNINGDGDLRIGGRASINSEQVVNAALFIKGRLNTANSWGQHIVLERTTTTDQAGILLDGDGIKMRFLNTTGQYYWRDSDNGNMMRLDANSNLFVGGNLVANGRGMVSSPNANQWQVREINQGNINFAGFAPGGVLYIDINISGLGFVAAPYATAIELESNSDNLKSSIFLTPVLLSTSTLRIGIRNVGTNTFTASGMSFRILLTGRRT